MTDQRETRDVCIVGAGPAGLTAGLFTARAGLDTLVVNAGEPILRRNAHLENVPGFPAGVNSRLFLDMLADQADRNGCARRDGQVTAVTDAYGDHLAVETDDGTVRTDYVVCTSWADTEYLDIDAVGLTHYKAEAPPSRSAGLPMRDWKHKRVGWGGSRQHPTVTHAQSQP